MYAFGSTVSADRLNQEVILTQVRSPLVVRQVRGELVRAFDYDNQPVWVHASWLDPVEDMRMAS
jgi:hypothetical protein